MKKDRREWEGDVTYEVWRRGGNVNAIDFERLDDKFYDGVEPDDVAAGIMRKERQRREERQREANEQEQQYYQEQYPEEKIPEESIEEVIGNPLFDRCTCMHLRRDHISEKSTCTHLGCSCREFEDELSEDRPTSGGE